MMLKNAREHGVDAHEGVRVHDVLFEGDRAVGVRIKDDDGSFREVRAKVVVDASGQNGLLMNRLRLRVWDPMLNKGAIWTYWEGAYRDTGRDEGATLVIQNGNKKGWFWYIPLHDNIVSVGVVAPFDYLFKGRADYAQTYDEEVEMCPGVKERVAQRDARHRAFRDQGLFVPLEAGGRQWLGAGRRCVRISRSAVFVGRAAGAEVRRAGRRRDRRRARRRTTRRRRSLASGAPEFNEGVDRMRRLVCEYYDGFSFGKMVRQYPDLRDTLTDLLIGDLFNDGVDKVWGPLESLYQPGKQPIPRWDAGTPAAAAPGKTNELMLPDGRRP